ncbi:hypothetical protein [Caballeronia sordidicola]|uniref:Uncharacterized protein n=1 Tax=Caballeronia sordidicola TaxID=196367 RepID=A0A242MWX1_CABSO|nr:hypothetical protein [Caballeronia sordidicola]OTP75927.1 hypothetical protein PAMC26510_12355 [Caballeronia sordidicola]
MSPSVALSRHVAIAIATCRMRFAVAPPIVGVPCAPTGLSLRLILSIVGIGSQARTLPCPSPGQLTGR